VAQRGLVCVLASVALLCTSDDALAGAAAKLTYVRQSGAERCAGEAQLREAVSARVGYDLFFPWAQKSVVVEVDAAKPRGYRGVVQIVDERGLVVGQRSLDSKSDDCADLIRALALTISIAVDDRSLEYVPPPAPAAAAPDPPAVESPPAARPDPPSEGPKEKPQPASPAPSPSFSAWVTPLVAIGPASSTAVGAEAEAAARFRNVSLGLGIRADAPAPAAGGSVTTWLVAGTLAPCLHGPLHTSYCGLALAGWYAADGHVTPPKQDGEPFLAAGGRVGLDVPLGRRVLFVSHADALAALTRFDVRVGDVSAFRVPAVSFALGAGLGVVF
jgi:hypothetical protein